MVPAILGDAKFWQLLVRFDEDLAGEVRSARCPHCGGALHSARYRRKPRGVARALLGEAYAQRLSFCCAREGCRLRTTPASVRFLGRRVYLGAFVVLISALSRGLSGVRRTQLRKQFTPALSDRTLRRWRRWWTEVFAATRWWHGAGGRFMPPIDSVELPGVFLERFGASAPGQRMLDVLAFLRPFSLHAQRIR